MAEEDEEKTAFYTEHGTFCYEKMPFGLRNAGATYQRLVDKAFSSQLGRNIEIYVDDMAIKSRNVGSLIADIEETFHTLRRINMKLNLKNVFRQKKRVLAERNDAVNQEVIKLIKAIILKEVYSPRWVTNPVMIRMAEEDEEKTAFYTEHRTFCYEKMPFGLRNAGATYQRLVDKAFSSQLGRNIEIYVKDMAMKSRNVKSLIADIEETFHTSIFLIRSSHKEIPG
ncbi:reverse transcriptase domain-containing protein [Tanacetum coccineum]